MTKKFPHLPIAIVALAMLSSITSLHAQGTDTQTPEKIAAFVPSRVESGAFLKLRIEIAETLARLARDSNYQTASRSLDKNTLRLLYIHEILTRSSTGAIQKEAKENPAFRKFITSFFSDNDWMEAYLTTMNVPKDIRGLTILSEIYEAEGSSENFSRYKDLACAIAAAWCNPCASHLRLLETAPEKGKSTPLGRFTFFRNAHREGRLSSSFEHLRSWDTEFLVGTFPWDDESLEFLNRNVQLPTSGFLTIAWCGDYSYYTAFGDNVQTGNFYVPWRGKMSMAENIARHGGVCGAVSNYAQAAAIAHGIPATTMGQPGHCAYGIRPALNKWIGGYGGPEGTQHYSCWGSPSGQESFSHLVLADTVYGARARLVEGIRHYAYYNLLHKSAKADLLAKDALEAALTASPDNLNFYREKLRFMEETRATDLQWIQFIKDIVARAEGIKGRVFFDLAGEALTRKSGDAQIDAIKLEIFKKSLPSLLAQTPSWNWTVSNVIKSLASSLDKSKQREMALILADQVWKSPKEPGTRSILPTLAELTAENALSEADLFEIVPKIVDTYTHATENSQRGGLSDKEAEKFLGDGLIDAIKAVEKKNVTLRNFLCQERYRSIQIPENQAKPDLLVSPLEGDKPVGVAISLDARINTPHMPEKSLLILGGFAHTSGYPALRGNGRTPPTFEIELPAVRTSSGILIAPHYKTPSAIIVRVSPDGQTWKQVSAGIIKDGNYVINFPEGESVKSVRVEMTPTQRKPAQLSSIIVFGKEIK